MFRVATNYQSMVARRGLNNLVDNQSKERTKLSSGSRIYQAAFDPSGVAISIDVANGIWNMSFDIL